jgi:hypothetical protein
MLSICYVWRMFYITGNDVLSFERLFMYVVLFSSTCNTILLQQNVTHILYVITSKQHLQRTRNNITYNTRCVCYFTHILLRMFHFLQNDPIEWHRLESAYRRMVFSRIFADNEQQIACIFCDQQLKNEKTGYAHVIKCGKLQLKSIEPCDDNVHPNSFRLAAYKVRVCLFVCLCEHLLFSIVIYCIC